MYSSDDPCKGKKTLEKETRFSTLTPVTDYANASGRKLEKTNAHTSDDSPQRGGGGGGAVEQDLSFDPDMNGF